MSASWVKMIERRPSNESVLNEHEHDLLLVLPSRDLCGVRCDVLGGVPEEAGSRVRGFVVFLYGEGVLSSLFVVGCWMLAAGPLAASALAAHVSGPTGWTCRPVLG